jgi:hypothetical protein
MPCNQRIAEKPRVYATIFLFPKYNHKDAFSRAAFVGVSSMSELESLTSRAVQLSAKADFWNNAVLWSLALTALAAVAIVVSQRLAFVRTKQLTVVQDRIARIKEDAAKGRQDVIATELAAAVAKAKEADARIAEAERGSAEANERATQAQKSLALAEQHAAEANTKAEGFRLDIAKANERAASANETAERERLARLQLEARLADRVITPDQQRRITEAFAPMKGQTIDVVIVGDSLEITKTATAILDSLHKAGILFNIAQPLKGGYAEGVIVGIRLDATTEVKQAGNLLIGILRETLGGGVGQKDFDKIQVSMTGQMRADPGATPRGQSSFRLLIAAK